MKKILHWLVSWYKGDDGEPEYNPVTETFTYKRKPYRHWLARVISYFFDIIFNVFQLIKKNPNPFITQLFAFIAILLSASSFYFQVYKDDDEYKRCTITHSTENEITLKCKK